jgi:hypothetical protein
VAANASGERGDVSLEPSNKALEKDVTCPGNENDTLNQKIEQIKEPGDWRTPGS